MKFKNKIRITTAMMCLVPSVSVVNASNNLTNYNTFEYNYKFESGVNNKEVFGIPTETKEVVVNTNNENIRRNKDMSVLPTSFNMYSGVIPTEQSNIYIAPNSTQSVQNATYATVDERIYNYNEPLEPLQSTSLFEMNQIITAPSYYEDGSIGRLKINKIGVDIKVYEGESLDNMKHGVGHFANTSAWDGNVAFAGHNRGSSGYFKDVKNLTIGDRLTYVTPYGTRTYKVIVKEKISDTDFSGLGWSDRNILTLITCVENVPSQRWLIQAEQVK